MEMFPTLRSMTIAALKPKTATRSRSGRLVACKNRRQTAISATASPSLSPSQTVAAVWTGSQVSGRKSASVAGG
jgi:hypothetical protein